MKRRKRTPLDANTLKCSLSTALRELETVFLDETLDAETRIKAAAATATIANSYAKLQKEAEAQQQNPDNPFLKKLNPVLAGQAKPKPKVSTGY